MAKKSKNGRWIWTIFVVLLALAYLYFGEPLKAEDTLPNPNVSTPTTSSINHSSSPSLDKWYEVYFTNPKNPFDDVYRGGIEQYLIEKIDASKKTIDVAVFEFDLESVAQALIRAQNRGVRVRIVYDDEHTDPDPQIGKVKAAGIPTVADQRSAFMHNKFFVFDNLCIWTGSFNISLNAAYRNNENALYFCSSEVAQNYRAEFNEMYSGSFGPSSISDTPFPIFYIGNTKVENYFAPEDRVMEKVLRAVSNADSYIHFMAYSFTDDDLSQAMITRTERGVIVEGIFETTGADTQYSECGRLLNRGLDVRLDGNPRTFHHKVIILDDETVILGSFNFSNNANTQNDENLLIIHDKNLASAYENQYQLMKSQAYTPTGSSCSK